MTDFDRVNYVNYGLRGCFEKLSMTPMRDERVYGATVEPTGLIQIVPRLPST